MPDPDAQGCFYVGLMSGTSMDGIDAVLIEFREQRCEIRAHHAARYPNELRTALHAAIRAPEQCDVDAIGQLDCWIGECFRDAVLELLTQSQTSRDQIIAIGSHGQTLRHQPRAKRPYTLQIGDPNIIAAGTGITTVADFRRRDLAVGGHGAPLAPAFHHWLFASDRIDRVVLNIGGIANITVLSSDGSEPLGFDTGPGNTLMDAWIRQHRNIGFDDNGDWATSGQVSSGLLDNMLQDAYFAEAPPKSTGLEYFNMDWLRCKLAAFGELAPADVQATLSAFTAKSVAAAIREHAPASRQLLVCGGGVHNGHLLGQLSADLSGVEVTSTAALGLHPDWVEAMAFAWLAKRCLERKPGNLPTVTGATRETILGGIYLSSS